jgi:hypothetical protein
MFTQRKSRPPGGPIAAGNWAGDQSLAQFCGGVFTIAALFIIVNLIIHIANGLLNPRAGEAMQR